MGNETIQDTSFFNEKREKQGKNRKNRGMNTKKPGKNSEKTENYKKYRNKILTRFREMLKTETSFRQDFGKPQKRKRKQKRGLLECHETTIREQKRCIVPPLGETLRWSSSCSGQSKGWVGVERLFPVRPVANEGFFIEEYTCSTTGLVCAHDCFSSIWLSVYSLAVTHPSINTFLAL